MSWKSWAVPRLDHMFLEVLLPESELSFVNSVFDYIIQSPKLTFLYDYYYYYYHYYHSYCCYCYYHYYYYYYYYCYITTATTTKCNKSKLHYASLRRFYV